jgi:autotransporter-associated beta strand protein
VDELTLSGVNTFSGTTIVDAGILTLSGGSALINSMAVTVGASGTLNLASSEEIASLAGAGAVNLQGNVMSVSGAVDTTFSGVMSGAGSLVKTGAAVFTLSGANTFSGGVTLSDGAIQAGDNAALGMGTVTLSGGRISSDSATARTLANAFAMSGTLGLGDASNNGELILSGDGLLTGTTTLTVASAVDMSGALSGVHNLTKSGSAALTLSGVNTFSGALTVSYGALILNGGSALADSVALALASNGALNLLNSEVIGTLAGSGSVVLQSNTLTVSGGVDTNFAGAIQGAGAFVKDGAATFTLSGSSTFAGGTTVRQGTLLLAASNLLNTAGAMTLGGGVLDLGGLEQMFGLVTLGSGTIRNGLFASSQDVEAQDGILDAVLAGTRGLVMNGSGGLLLIKQANTFTGTMSISAGQVRLTDNERLSDASRVVLNGGVLNLNGFTETVNRINVRSGSIIGGTLNSLGFEVESGIVTSVFNGSGRLYKITSGTVDLQSINTYTGGTQVEDGVLRLSAGGRLPSVGELRMLDGEFDLNGYTQTVGSLTLDGGLVSNGILNAGSYLTSGGSVAAVLSGTGALSKVGAGTVLLGGANTYEGGTTVNQGVLLLGGSQRLWDQGALTVLGGTFDLGGHSQTLGVVSMLGGLISNGVLTGSTYLMQAGEVGGVIAGTASLLKSGAGTLTLGGSNVYSGGTNVTEGVLVLGASERLLDAGSVTVSGGVFDLGTYSETVGIVRLTGGTIQNGLLNGGSYLLEAGSISAVLGGAAELHKKSAGFVVLSGSNTYSGGTTVWDGSLMLGAAERLTDLGALTINGGVLDLGTYAETVGAVSLFGGLIRNGTLTGSAFAVEAGSVSAVLAGTAALAKTGEGTVTLTGV